MHPLRTLLFAALRRGRRCLGYVRVNAIATNYCYGDVTAVVGGGRLGLSAETLRILRDKGVV